MFNIIQISIYSFKLIYKISLTIKLDNYLTFEGCRPRFNYVVAHESVAHQELYYLKKDLFFPLAWEVMNDKN